jgi:Mn-dependent DtxR family transcriptional regulator
MPVFARKSMRCWSEATATYRQICVRQNSLARKLVELRVSAIIDIYDLKIQDRREYVRRFLDALMNLPKELWGPLIVVIDEAHKLCPEKGQGESVATQPVIDLMSQGGKRQFCGILITQRFSKLHNDAIAECNNVFIGRTWMDTDQIRAGKYLGMSPAERQALRELPQGEFYAFGPALSESGVLRFKGDRAETRVPKPGERHKVKPPKASDAIKHIVSQIDDLPEVAEQERKDLASVTAAAAKREAELKTQIHSLEAELKKAAKPVEVPKEILVYPTEKLAELEDAVDQYFKPFAAFVDQVQSQAQTIERLVGELQEARRQTEPTVSQTAAPVPGLKYHLEAIEKDPTYQGVPPSVLNAPERSAPLRIHRVTDDGDRISPAPETSDLNDTEQRIINTLASFKAIGQPNIKRSNIAAFIGYAPSTKSFTYAMSALSTRGLIATAGAGMVTLTSQGQSFAADQVEVPTLAALHKAWLDKLDGVQQQIIRSLLANREPLTRSYLADVCNLSESTKSFTYALSGLRDLGLTENAPNKSIRLTNMLFPEGLK